MHLAHQYSDIAFTNTYLTAAADTSNMFVDMAEYSVALSCATSGCPLGSYGQCYAFGSCYSCEIDVCHGCPVGKYSNRAGLVSISDCTSCEEGKFSNLKGAVSCTTCQSGYYASNENMTDEGGDGVASNAQFCVPCPAGKQSERSSYYCNDCEAAKLWLRA